MLYRAEKTAAIDAENPDLVRRKVEPRQAHSSVFKSELHRLARDHVEHARRSLLEREGQRQVLRRAAALISEVSSARTRARAEVVGVLVVVAVVAAVLSEGT